jgi:GMP synthase-like glutamine amidotransferase
LQVICRALGGKTGRATNGWECGLKAITLADAMSSMRYWHPHLPSTLRIMEVHQDEVMSCLLYHPNIYTEIKDSLLNSSV